MSVSAHPYGVVKDASPSVSVTLLADGDIETAADSVSVGVRFASDGDEYELNSGFWSSVHTYLNSGNSSDVWVAFTRTGGTQTEWVGKTNGTRYNLGSDQTFTISAAVVTVEETETITGFFTAYDAASGGNVLDTSDSATWTATATPT